MKPHHLSSKNNPILKEYRKLLTNRNYRRKNEKIAVEGPNLVKEALQAGLIPEVVLMAENYGCGIEKKWLTDLPLSTQQIFLSPALFKELAETETPQEVAAIFPFVFRDEKTETKKNGPTGDELDVLVRQIELHKEDLQKHYDVHIGKDLICCSEDCWPWDISALINRLEMVIDDISNARLEPRGNRVGSEPLLGDNGGAK